MSVSEGVCMTLCVFTHSTADNMNTVDLVKLMPSYLFVLACFWRLFTLQLSGGKTQTFPVSVVSLYS